MTREEMRFEVAKQMLPQAGIGREPDDAARIALEYADALLSALGEERQDVNAELVEALEALLRRDEINTCDHTETRRLGLLWEECTLCGARWADDEGGRPEWQEPAEWGAARAALARAKGGNNV